MVEPEILEKVYKQQQTLADNQTIVADRLGTVGSQIAASNRAIIRAVDSLDASEKRQQADERALVALAQQIQELLRQQDPELMSPEELADCMTLEKASMVRQVLWQRKNAHRGPQQPLPLPPIADDLVHIPQPRNDEPTQKQQPHNRRKGDSISTMVDKKGMRWYHLNFKFSNDSAKDAFKWLVASGLGAAMLKAIQHAWHAWSAL